MAEITQVVCDECGAVRGKANHWRVVLFDTESILLTPIPVSKEIQLWSRADVCGDSCLHKFIDRKLKIGAHREKQNANL